MRSACLLPIAFALLASPALAAHPLDESQAVPGRTHVWFSFNELDVNEDGVIQRTEAAFKPALANNFAYADKNNDGLLNRPEYTGALTMSAEMFGGPFSREKRDLFRSLDRDGNAVISRTEARRRPALADAFERIDANGNGSLDMGEFAEISLADLGSR